MPPVLLLESHDQPRALGKAHRLLEMKYRRVRCIQLPALAVHGPARIGAAIDGLFDFVTSLRDIGFRAQRQTEGSLLIRNGGLRRPRTGRRWLNT